MPRIVDPKRAQLPKNRREFAAALLACKAATLRNAAFTLEHRGRQPDPEDARQTLLGFANNIDGESGDVEYVRGSASADAVDDAIAECLRPAPARPRPVRSHEDLVLAAIKALAACSSWGGRAEVLLDVDRRTLRDVLGDIVDEVSRHRGEPEADAAIDALAKLWVSTCPPRP